MEQPLGSSSSCSPRAMMFGGDRIANSITSFNLTNNDYQIPNNDYQIPNIDSLNSMYIQHGEGVHDTMANVSGEVQKHGGEHFANVGHPEGNGQMQHMQAMIQNRLPQFPSENKFHGAVEHGYGHGNGIGVPMYIEHSMQANISPAHSYYNGTETAATAPNAANFSQIQTGIERNQPYSIDSPLITPASVFSTMSSASTNDFFSPITSPALQPQIQRHRNLSSLDLDSMQRLPDLSLSSPQALGEEITSTPPGALGNIERPRRSRNNTSESRSSKVRPSPLSKNIPARNAGNTSSLLTSPAMSHGKEMQHTEFRPSSLHALESLPNTLQETGELVHTNDSPSPIDLGAERGLQKPITPAAIMGMAGSIKGSPAPDAGVHHVRGADFAVNSHHEHGSTSPAVVHSPAALAARESEVKHLPTQSAANAVAANALAAQSQGPYYTGPVMSVHHQRQHQSILPGMLSAAERNAWINMRRAGSGVDQRRTSHKAAEQKRRDSLKHCFDDLRSLLPGIALDDSIPGGSALGPDGSREDQIAEGFDPEALAKAASEVGEEPPRPDMVALSPEQAREANRVVAKVLLLRHSNEYLVRLKNRVERRDMALQALSEEVVRLRNELENIKKSKSGPELQVSTRVDRLDNDTAAQGKAVDTAVTGHTTNDNARERDAPRDTPAPS